MPSFTRSTPLLLALAMLSLAYCCCVVQAFMLQIVLVALHEPRHSQGREKEIEREPSREPSGCQSLVSEPTTRTRRLLMLAASGTDA